MRILRIAGRNLASLAGDFEVDFQAGQLAGAGLFAISGPTGAGKSTLLDALCLALYDATPRLLKTATAAKLADVGEDVVSIQDPRTLLRRGAADGFAEVDFEASDNQRYRARWSVRRSRNKASGSLQRADMTLHTLPALAPLGRTNKEVLAEIAQRVGLNFEQFTRSVLLAQNEFSAFLKTDENERGELLETLTGSTIYSSLSRRAFSRHRDEQERLKLVTARLADQVPMPAEERAATESAYASAAAALAVLEDRKLVLERALRWFEDAARLREGLEAAKSACAQADSAHVAAQERRAQLTAIDQVQAARPLLTELDRLSQQKTTLDVAAVHAAADAQSRTEASAIAQASLASASAALDAVQLAIREAQPALDQAKAHDARLATLAGPLQLAQQRHAALETELAAATSAIASADTARAAVAAEQVALGGWLAQHAGAAGLAQQWERWDGLLKRAAGTSDAITVQAATQAGARDAHVLSVEALARARQSVDAITIQLETARQARDAASAQLQSQDMAGLQTDRATLEQRAKAWQLARAQWQAWTSASDARQKAETALYKARALLDTHLSELAVATDRLPALEATTAQARRSLDLARLACADDVESLRGQLQDDQPCPVCGSEDHPYKASAPALHALLAQLEADANDAGTRLDQARTHIAALQERAASARAQVDRDTEDLSRHSEALAAAQAAWQGHPDYQPAADVNWFDASDVELNAEAVALAAREQALNTVIAARDAAQQALDLAIQSRDAAVRDREKAAGEAAAAQAALDGATTRLEQLRQSLAADLDELATPLSKISNIMDENFEHRWREQPAAVHTALAGLATEWTSKDTAQIRAQQVAADLAKQLVTANADRDRIQGALAAAREELSAMESSMEALRQQRATLCEGRSVADVEQTFQNQLDEARTRHQAAAAAATAAAQAVALAQAAQQQSNAAQAANAADMQAARAAVSAWFETHPGMDEPSLASLLAHSPEWVREEREFLASIDQARASTHAVLAERHAQLERHLAGKLADDNQTADSTRTALQTLTTERDSALAHAAALRRALDQDDARRTSASALQEQLERQQQEERRWARLSELIGSADGKKFRNYAQQFTLDVLLGYANAHLHQLARRYRLERVASATGPSLGLMVRDQDMGGEIRSVNSLSGGESFLVSLALALGLASLSSNRIRVESLFIDEGFGSLDSETLRVALDALDGLQATGRRVGVISHVQEMTERIAVRILVQPSGGGSSTVSVA